MYVTAIDANTGVVTLGNADDLLRRSFFLTGVNWTSDATPEQAIHAAVRIRYRSPEAAAEIRPTEYGAEVEFEEPQRAVTPGQVAVFYDSDEVLGGGTIELAPPAADNGSPTANSGASTQSRG
jgi:tRNA-specific 2-thiouridylase